MIEEKVIQQESVAPVEQSVAATDATQTTPAPTVDIDALKAELAQEKASREKAEKSFGELKSKVDEMYKKADEKRVKSLENQGEYKPLWEEANKTNQERVKEIEVLKGQIEELKRSTENAATRNNALAALSNAGAINAGQTLSLLQDKLQKSSDGRTVILSGGVEQDLGTYINNLKNPGSGWEHHFKASSAAGMGVKPSPTSNVAPGQENPWKTGNLTQQMILSNQDPDLAAVLQREASQ
tara:strand:+ start:328 stop:1047 length:720 start_codon:yes stop_codon:yes gene_type:complete